MFVNKTMKEYCEQADIVFTGCRPYRKNDQAFVKQKNGAVVRRMVGYGAALSLGPFVRELLPAIVQYTSPESPPLLERNGGVK
ncbi:hypothetical protein GCM10007857_90190 [Bradyrhizobium iriomotense]|uniref:Uncharacterized protein n=1 Tax=Bradyrhizobium iriomotense TaxID=441950 RepID=A0ABQ6BF19_9BRAD|nr:hypothetical protein GCM10007857_90190 [Bradyrhizobium iriomotense]